MATPISSVGTQVYEQLIDHTPHSLDTPPLAPSKSMSGWYACIMNLRLVYFHACSFGVDHCYWQIMSLTSDNG